MYNSTKSYQIWLQRLDPYTLEKKLTDELTADTSSAYSITDELLLFDDYNRSNNNRRNNNRSWFFSKNQIQEVQIFHHQLKYKT